MTPQQQLEGFIDRFSPAVAAVARQAIRAMRARYPTAEVLVYDNYNALAVAFSPNDASSSAIFSIAVYPGYASLFFAQNGARLRDPQQRLEGKGAVMRHIKLRSAADLDDPVIAALMAEELARARLPFAASGKGKVAIKSVSARQRPRRPGG